MERRTLDGVKGYVDGYGDCYRQFVNYLGNYLPEDAITKMGVLMLAVENVLKEIPQTDCAWSKCDD